MVHGIHPKHHHHKSHQNGRSVSLSDEQKGQMQDILSKYNPEDMNKADRKAMYKELKDADIPLGRESRSIMRDAGFKVQKHHHHRADHGDKPIPMTGEQKAAMQEILSKYDPENMSRADRKALFDELKAADIPRGRESREILKEAGFEFKGHRHHKMGKDFVEKPAFLTDFESKFEAGEVTNEDISNLLENLKSLGKFRTGLLADAKG